MEDIIPHGWTVEKIGGGNVAVWDANGKPLGIWEQYALRNHFKSLFV